MEWVAVGSLLAAGAGGAIAQRRAGQYQDIQYRQQAQQEQDASRDREIDRRRRLVSALASQNAEAGALGAAPGVGSRAAIALTDARRAGYESLADRASTNRRSLLLRSAGREARKQGNLGAFATAAETTAQVIDAWPS